MEIPKDIKINAKAIVTFDAFDGEGNYYETYTGTGSFAIAFVVENGEISAVYHGDISREEFFDIAFAMSKAYVAIFEEGVEGNV